MNKPNYEYLTLIQGVINRLSNNSFVVKGWSITLTAAILAIAGTLSSNKTFNSHMFFWLNAASLLVFLWLDSYFYYNELKYRKTYDYARDMSKFNPSHLFDLNPNLLISEEEDNKISVRMSTLKERAVYPIYLSQLLFIGFIYFYLL